LTIYADSSFLVPLYALDVHSPETVQRMAMRPAIYLTPLNRAELAHALNRHVFRGRITSVDADDAWSEFRKDCGLGVWVEVDLPPGTWQTSIGVARRYGPVLGVRTLDSLHVACALELQADRFWTFDERQAKLAEAVGLNTTP
jgi:predicted nucleic acid-binding protein